MAHRIKTIRINDEVYDFFKNHSVSVWIVKTGTAAQIKRGSFGCSLRTAKAYENKIVACLALHNGESWRGNYILPTTPCGELLRVAIIKNDGTITNLSDTQRIEKEDISKYYCERNAKTITTRQWNTTYYDKNWGGYSY